MVPRHTWLGKKTVTRHHKYKKHLFDDLHIFYQVCLYKSYNMVPKWSQNSPPTPPHLRLGKKTATRQNKSKKNTWGVIFVYINNN